MELGKQIKKYRNEFSLSQDALAEMVYVSRQTISNWENDKSYPDVNSLVLLSKVFNTSIDNLIKGDVDMMREKVRDEDKKDFETKSGIFAILLLATMITPIPCIHFLGYVGMAIWGVLAVFTLYFSILVEKKKKQFDIQTYKEIIAFSEGKGLDEISKAREQGKRPYQKVVLAFASGAITLFIAIIFMLILK